MFKKMSLIMNIKINILNVWNYIIFLKKIIYNLNKNIKLFIKLNSFIFLEYVTSLLLHKYVVYGLKKL